MAMVYGHAQELYVYSEPASNMPARSIGAKVTSKWLRNATNNRVENRQMPEIGFGLNKNLMIHAATSFSNMYSSNLRWEGVRTYAKYRFYTSDDMYSHFRMAAFAEAAYSRNISPWDEINLDGDQSGWRTGIIATQLLHKLAISGTLGYTASLQKGKNSGIGPNVPYQAMGYSLSAGYLVLPKKYTGYGQTNLNLYVELLGQNTLDKKRSYLDLAPAAQLIFDSQAKLNLGYRFQLSGDMNRMAKQSWMVSFEWLFLNAFK